MAAPSWYLPGSPADQLYQAQVAADPRTPQPIGLGGLAGNAPAGMPGLGALAGLPGIGGSSAAGRIPQVPDPTATAGGALAGNLANLAKLRQLFNRTSAAVGVTPEFTAGETGLIRELQNAPRFLGAYPDLSRQTAEFGTAQGVAGSPAEQTLGYRLSDEEQLRRRAMASQMLGQRAARANQILPLQNFMQTPQERQIWQNFANTIAAGADPEEAFRRALSLAQAGINRGIGAGYGGGAPRVGAAPSPGSTYAGDVNWNALNAARAAATPGWATLPSMVPETGRLGVGGMVNPNRPSFGYSGGQLQGEDWLDTLGLGRGQEGVTITPTEDLYS